MNIPIFRTSNYGNHLYGVCAKDSGPKAPCESAKYVGLVNGSQINHRFDVEINTLEDLIALIKEVEQPIILSVAEWPYKGELSIEIYDDWRE